MKWQRFHKINQALKLAKSKLFCPIPTPAPWVTARMLQILGAKAMLAFYLQRHSILRQQHYNTTKYAHMYIHTHISAQCAIQIPTLCFMLCLHWRYESSASLYIYLTADLLLLTTQPAVNSVRRQNYLYTYMYTYLHNQQCYSLH